MEFTFQTDDETKCLLEISVYFLQKYFLYDENKAIELMNEYYNTWKHVHTSDDFYHHEGAFHVAVLVHYIIGLRGKIGVFSFWRRDNGFLETPREALEYFERNYFIN